jgi:hypothetical protein
VHPQDTICIQTPYAYRPIQPASSQLIQKPSEFRLDSFYICVYGLTWDSIKVFDYNILSRSHNPFSQVQQMLSPFWSSKVTFSVSCAFSSYTARQILNQCKNIFMETYYCPIKPQSGPLSGKPTDFRLFLNLFLSRAYFSNVHYRLYKCPALIPILNHTNPANVVISCRVPEDISMLLLPVLRYYK